MQGTLKTNKTNDTQKKKKSMVGNFNSSTVKPAIIPEAATVRWCERPGLLLTEQSKRKNCTQHAKTSHDGKKKPAWKATCKTRRYYSEVETWMTLHPFFFGSFFFFFFFFVLVDFTHHLKRTSLSPTLVLIRAQRREPPKFFEKNFGTVLNLEKNPPPPPS